MIHPIRIRRVLLASTLTGILPLAAWAFAPLAPDPASPALATAAQDEFTDARDAAQAALVEALVEYADWAGKQKLFADRDSAFEQVLEYEPDHVRARKALGWSRDSDGAWVPPKNRRPSKNYKPKLADESAAKRKAACEPYRLALLDLLDRFGGDEKSERSEWIVSELLNIDPDDPDLHARRGEVQLGEKWVLAETVAGVEGRKRLQEIVRETIRELPERGKPEPTAAEKAMGPAWVAVRTTPDVRALSSVDAEEADRVAQIAHATGVVFRKHFGTAAPFPEDFTIYMLTIPERERFLSNFESVDERQMRFLSQLDGSGIPTTANGAWWIDEPPRRLDGVSRHTIAQFLVQEFGIRPTHGWAFEGFGLYLTRELVGTRLTWFVHLQEDETVADREKHAKLRARLLNPKANWHTEAIGLLEGPRAPKLEAVLRADVNKMTIAEMLHGYMLAAYLIEARPEKVATILTRIGTSENDPVFVFREELGMEIDELENHLVRWLEERP